MQDFNLKELQLSLFAFAMLGRTSGQGWIRTTELVRGQIYSLLPLATWLLAHLVNSQPLVAGSYLLFRSHLSESNQRPTDYKSVALPAELKWHLKMPAFFLRANGRCLH